MASAEMGLRRGEPGEFNFNQSQPMKITLSRCVVRSFVPADVDSVTKHVASPQVARYMSALPHPYYRHHAEEWIALATSGEPETHFGIEVDGEIVGGIGIQHEAAQKLAVCAHDAEIGYWLGESYWGRGLATEALSALTDWAFTSLGLRRLHAAVYAPNTASTRVLEKAGYTFEGRLRARYFRAGQFIDGLLYAKVQLPPAL